MEISIKENLGRIVYKYTEMPCMRDKYCCYRCMEQKGEEIVKKIYDFIQSLSREAFQDLKKTFEEKYKVPEGNIRFSSLSRVQAIIEDFEKEIERFFRDDMVVIITLGNSDKIIMNKRVLRAREYYEENKTKKSMVFMFSGHNGEAQYMKDYLYSLDVKHPVFLETKSSDTVENLKFCKQILDRFLGIPSVVICTSTFHMPRTAMIALRILTENRVTFIDTFEKPERQDREAKYIKRLNI